MRLTRLSLLLPLVALPTMASAQSMPDGAFIVRLGTDTIAVERFSRSGSEYSVEQVLRSPRTTLRHSHLGLTPAGEITQIFYMNHVIGDMAAPLLGYTKLTLDGGDSAVVEMKQGDSTRTRRVPAPRGMIPQLPTSFLPYEMAATRLRAAGGDSLAVTLVGPGGGTMPIVARKLGSDSMTFRLPFLTYRARVDANGRIMGLYQPLGTAVERVSNVDINGLATTWKKLDEGGKAMGALSPLDSTTVKVGDATISLRYARPRTRGRRIFGNIVPFDTVWRTGANDATVFATDQELRIGNTTVPAGRYTLFTLPSRSATLLILNKETTRDGEPLAGTDYDSKNDLARIPMTTRTVSAPVEQLTIELQPGSARQGVLRIVWDSREMTVPVVDR
jgi:hypothetical protein